MGGVRSRIADLKTKLLLQRKAIGFILLSIVLASGVTTAVVAIPEVAVV
jgi:hypothetical protein